MKNKKKHCLKRFTLLFLSFAGLSGYPKITETDHDVCNLDTIYNATYSYSLPREILQSYLSGKAFDHFEEYSPKEAEKLSADINQLFHSIVDSNPVKKRQAVISAGSPGAGKTTLLRQKLDAASQEGSIYAYICPDDVCLKNQIRTYVADIEASGSSLNAREEAYTKWRPGSNAATHLLLANLIKENYAFYFGTTCQSPLTFKFFEFLKAQGYRIKIIHVSAPDEVRWGSIHERDKFFVQTTEEDVCEKGKMVPQRLNDTFLKYADEIEFYYRPFVESDALLAATWIRIDGTSKGNLTILDKEAYEGVKAVHNAVIETLQLPELLWENTAKAASIFSE